MVITYKRSAGGRLQAAYSHLMRIGYVETIRDNKYRWQLIFVPGPQYMGWEETEEAAKDELEKRYRHWLTSAGLKGEDT